MPVVSLDVESEEEGAQVGKEGWTMRNGSDYARNVRIECIHRVGRTGSCLWPWREADTLPRRNEMKTCVRKSRLPAE